MPNFIQVSPNSTGLKVDMSELIVGSNTVERQNLTISDPASVLALTSSQVKGSQSLYALATQDLKDTGRISVCFTMTWSYSSTIEAIGGFGIAKFGNANTTGNTQYTVTLGKTLRLQCMTQGSYCTAQYGEWFGIRGNASGGAATLSSNLLYQMPFVANAGWVGVQTVVIPDGFEIAGGTTIAFTFFTSGGTGYYYGAIIGYEY